MENIALYCSFLSLVVTSVTMATAVQEKRDSENWSKFQWSCRPILIWMNLIGVPLNLSNAGLIRCNFVFVYSLFLFTKETAMAIFVGMRLFTSDFQSNNLESSTQKWNDWINGLNDGITTFGTHFALISFSLVKWKDLASILDNLEKLNIFQQETFNQFRRVCWWGLGVIILDAAVFVIGVIALPHFICWCYNLAEIIYSLWFPSFTSLSNECFYSDFLFVSHGINHA